MAIKYLPDIQLISEKKKEMDIATHQTRSKLTIDTSNIHFLDIINDTEDQELLVRYVLENEYAMEQPLITILPKGRSRVCLCSPLMRHSGLELKACDPCETINNIWTKRELTYMGFSVNDDELITAYIQIRNFNCPQSLLYLSTPFVPTEKTEQYSQESRINMFQWPEECVLFFDLAWEGYATCSDHGVDL